MMCNRYITVIALMCLLSSTSIHVSTSARISDATKATLDMDVELHVKGVKCPVGRYVVGDICVSCPAGSYADVPLFDGEKCKKCPPHFLFT